MEQNESLSKFNESFLRVNTSISVFSHEEVMSFTIALCIFSFVGIIANFITFFVIVTTNSLNKSAFNIFIASLCVSDFISAVFSLLILYARAWGFKEFAIPTIFCKFSISVDMWTSVTTIQHILIFSFIRSFSVQFPMKIKFLTPKIAKIIVSAIWFETFLVVFIPYTIWPTVRPKSPWYSCTMGSEWLSDIKKYMMYGFPVLFYVPLALISFNSIFVIIILMRKRMLRKQKNDPGANNKVRAQRENYRRRKENMAVGQLLLIISSFMFGYIPDIAYRMYVINIRMDFTNPHSLHTIWLYGMLSHTLLRLSEVMNPFLYNLASSKLRKATIVFLSRCCGRITVKKANRNTALRTTNIIESKKTSLPLT